MKAKGGLTEEAKRYVVHALACFDAPAVVAEAVRTEFGITITRQSCERYDPTKRAGRDLSDKLRTLFEESRKRFLEDTAEIGVAHRAVRLRALQRMANRAETTGNLALALQIYEQAAKEMGGAFTNRRELTGKDGGPQEHIVDARQLEDALRRVRDEY